MYLFKLSFSIPQTLNSTNMRPWGLKKLVISLCILVLLLTLYLLLLLLLILILLMILTLLLLLIRLLLLLMILPLHLLQENWNLQDSEATKWGAGNWTKGVQKKESPVMQIMYLNLCNDNPPSGEFVKIQLPWRRQEQEQGVGSGMDIDVLP